MTPIIGQKEQEQIFLDSFASGRLHHAWLLSGPKGIGKASFAKRAGLFLLAEPSQDNAADDYDGLFGDVSQLPARSFESAVGSQAQHLVEAGTHPEYHLLERRNRNKDKPDEVARNIPIDDVRALIQSLTGTPTIARYRVCIVDAIDDLERSAANALLKTLEEPPQDTVFFLVSHMPGRLLPTIRSRCRNLRFNAFPDAEMRVFLGHAAGHLPAADVDALIRSAKGSPGRALDIMDLGLGELQQQVRGLIAEGDPDNSKRHALSRSVSLKAAKPRYEALLDLAPEEAASWCHGQTGKALAQGLETWERLRDISQSALHGSYDPAMTSFEIGTLLAGLAHPRR